MGNLIDRISRFRFLVLLVVLSALCCLLPSYAQGQSENFRGLGQQIGELVRENFYDSKRASAWASTYTNYADETDSLIAFAGLTKRALAELKTSHTDFYTPSDVEYYGLLSIFSEALGAEAVEFESIGADFTRDHFVRVVFAGGPAAQAGLRRGDKVLRVDGKDFDPVASFHGKGGQHVILTVERAPGQGAIELVATGRKANPKNEWLEAQKLGSKIIERAGKSIAYVPMFSCTGEEYASALQETIFQKFRDAVALILDFRDGWGGCSPNFVNLFSILPAVQIYTDRNGRQRSGDAQWRKPLYVLINSGTRSGKEVVAFTLKKHKLGMLIGERTAGAVMGGRCFLLPGNFLLYLATLDVLNDGQRLEGQGVAPDVEVPAALPFADGIDPQLEKALEIAAR
jgi:carboxyl-terminal processing protease